MKMLTKNEILRSQVEGRRSKAFTVSFLALALLSPLSFIHVAAINGYRLMANVMKIDKCKLINEAGGRL